MRNCQFQVIVGDPIMTGRLPRMQMPEGTFPVQSRGQHRTCRRWWLGDRMALQNLFSITHTPTLDATKMLFPDPVQSILVRRRLPGRCENGGLGACRQPSAMVSSKGSQSQVESSGIAGKGSLTNTRRQSSNIGRLSLAEGLTNELGLGVEAAKCHVQS